LKKQGRKTKRTGRGIPAASIIFTQKKAETMSKKIIYISAENIKKLKVFKVNPTAAVTKYTGANGSGKTTALDVIEWALRGTDNIPNVPIRTGAERGEIIVEFDDIVVSRVFTKDGARTGVLKIEEKGTKKRINSPQTMLDKLMSKVSFDPLAFTRMNQAQQFKTLRPLVKLNVDLDALERENKADKATRREIKKEATALTNRANAIQIPAGIPQERADEAGLLQKLTDAAEYNSGIERERNRRRQIEDDLGQRLEQIEIKKRELDNLKSAIANMEATAKHTQATIKDWKKLDDPRDAADLQRQVEEAKRVNYFIDQRAQATKLTTDAEGILNRVTKLTEAIRQRDQEREDAMAAANFPIKGLAFAKVDPDDEDAEYEVFYNGLPFNQASSAEQIRASVAIGMSENAEIRVMRIEDASLLDDASFAEITKMAEEHDYQVFAEIVDTTGKVGVYLEDGEVAAVNTDEPTPATSKKAPRKKASK
jgi:hypothetical protein